MLSVNGALPTGIAASLDPLTGVLTLSGEASHDAYEAAIRQIEFSTTQPIGTQKRIDVILFDGQEWGPEAKAFITVGNVCWQHRCSGARSRLQRFQWCAGRTIPRRSPAAGRRYRLPTLTFPSPTPTALRSNRQRSRWRITAEPADVLSFTGPAARHDHPDCLRFRHRRPHAHRLGYPGRIPDSLAPSGLQHHEHFHC